MITLKKSIRLAFTPDHIVDGVKCPYCKENTIGVLETPVSPTLNRYTMHCVNEECVTNMRATTTLDIDSRLQNMVEDGELAQ